MCSEDINRLILKAGDADGICSQQLLTKIIRFACLKTGVQIRNSALTVEAITHENGCLLLVTVKSERNKRVTYRIKKKKECVCYIFDSADAFLNAYEYLRSNTKALRHCRIFIRDDGRYIIFPDGFLFPEKTDRFLCEYGVKKRKSRLFFAILAEKNSC